MHKVATGSLGSGCASTYKGFLFRLLCNVQTLLGYLDCCGVLIDCVGMFRLILKCLDCLWNAMFIVFGMLKLKTRLRSLKMYKKYQKLKIYPKT